MKKGDFIWIAVLGGIMLLLSLPVTHDLIMEETQQHPLIAGFIKFFILATMGDLLSIRISGGQWQQPTGLIYRAIVWGVMGFCITIVFEVFSTGVTAAIGRGFLPVGQGTIVAVAGAFWISTVMNVTFGPILIVFHRFADTFIDLAEGQFGKFASIRSEMVVKHILWPEFVVFIFKLQIFLWLPFHTLVFLLPPVYRVLAAAGLSIIFGAVLGYAKGRNAEAKQIVESSNVVAVEEWK